VNHDPEFVMARVNALAVPCPYCRAPVEDLCADPISGHVLEHQPAHVRRLQEAHVL
jgi:hypothetical protein